MSKKNFLSAFLEFSLNSIGFVAPSYFNKKAYAPIVVQQKDITLRDLINKS